MDVIEFASAQFPQWAGSSSQKGNFKPLRQDLHRFSHVGGGSEVECSEFQARRNKHSGISTFSRTRLSTYPPLRSKKASRFLILGVWDSWLPTPVGWFHQVRNRSAWRSSMGVDQEGDCGVDQESWCLRVTFYRNFLDWVVAPTLVRKTKQLDQNR